MACVRSLLFLLVPVACDQWRMRSSRFAVDACSCLLYSLPTVWIFFALTWCRFWHGHAAPSRKCPYRFVLHRARAVFRWAAGAYIVPFVAWTTLVLQSAFFGRQTRKGDIVYRAHGAMVVAHVASQCICDTFLFCPLHAQGRQYLNIHLTVL